MLLNIIYIYASDDKFDHIGNVKVIFSSKEKPNADIYIYFDLISYQACKPHPFSKNKLKVLYLTEPVCVLPNQYRQVIWKKFDFILTWNDFLCGDNYPTFIKVTYPLYNSESKIHILEQTKDELLARSNSICLISNNKKSLIKGELFSLRQKVADWFYQDGQIPLDIYGRLPMKLPNYKGEVEDKIQTYQHYRFALCFENCYLKNWSNGWITEKIFDAFYAQTVPIYYGCYNVEEYINPACFIDYRKFNSLLELRNYLKSMSDEEYLGYVTAIKQFLSDTPPQENYHLQKNILKLVERVKNTHLSNSQVINLPPDYLQTATSFREKFWFHVSCLIQKLPIGIVRFFVKLARLVR